MKLTGAIFDLDGTLLDSMSIWDTVGEAYLLAQGRQPEEGINLKFRSMSLRQAAVYYQTAYGVTDSAEEIMAGVNRMVERFYRTEVRPKPGVPGFLEALRRRGVPMCVATATDRYLVEDALTHAGIRDYFSAVFTCTEVGHGKDEPHIYEAALAYLGTPKAETPVFEDVLHAVRTAKEAGFPVVAVWEGTEQRREAVRALADVFLEDFERAEELLL